MSKDIFSSILQFAGNDQVTLAMLETPMIFLHNMGHPTDPRLEEIRLFRAVDKGALLPEIVGGKLQFASTQALQDLKQQLHG